MTHDETDDSRTNARKAIDDYERLTRDAATDAFSSHAWADLAGCHGYDLPEGWKALFGDALAEIDAALAGTEAKVRVGQVKEKFGTLRFYWSAVGADEEATAAVGTAIQKAEDRSGTTCVYCGGAGTMRNADGWISPFCDRDYPKANER